MVPPCQRDDMTISALAHELEVPRATDRVASFPVN
jgi:hypothetical protein